MLTFRKRDGYKARCPRCGKVVRLQPDGPAAAPVASVEIPDALDFTELQPTDPDAKMVAVVEDEVESEPSPLIDDRPWTWQWYAVGGGLIAWVGVLSILAWLWWQ
jgi:hypothetical protein